MKNLLLIIFLLMSLPSRAANFDTLPKGVRLAAFSKVATSTVGDYWGADGEKSLYGQDIKIGTDSISGSDIANTAFLDTLKSISNDAYENFSAGEWALKANSDVEVFGVGMGWGLTDRLTLFGVTTFWKAKVNMTVVQTKQNNYKETQAIIDSGENRSGLIIHPDSFPVITGGHIQNVVTNKYGYQPLGTWEAESMGDVELGLKYLLTKGDWGGLSSSLGTIIPLGRVDDPSVLQDFSFGNGFWTTYAELETTYQATKDLGIEMSVRYSHQFSISLDKRIPYSAQSSLSADTGVFGYDPGSKIKFQTGVPLYFNSWLSFTPKYIFEFDELDSYHSEYKLANSYLAQNTERISHSYRLDLVTDTVKAYFNKKFPIPFMAKIIYQKVFKGQNVPNVSRTQLELRMFF